MEMTQEQQRALALARARMRVKQKPPATEPAAKSKDIFTPETHSLVAGALQTAGDIGATLLAPADWLANKVLGENYDRRAEIRSGIQNMLMPDVESRAYLGGQLIAGGAGTAGVGPALAAGARAIPAVARFAPALETAGVGGPRVGNIPTRVAGGAVTGGVSTGLVSPESALTGAFIGGALPVAGLVGRGAALGYGYLQDVLTGRSAAINAANMLRQAAGGDLAAIQAANLASPNALASTAAVDAGGPTYQALLRIGEAKDPASAAYFARKAQEAAELDILRRGAGGATQTEARATRERGKGVLDEITRPMRERELELAGIGGTRGVALEQEAGRAGTAASRAVEDVRRFGRVAGDQYAGMRTEPRIEMPEILGRPAAEQLGVQQRANEWARNWRASGTGEGPTGLPRPPTAATYPGELAERAEQVAGQRAAESLEQGALRREAETRLATLRAAGLEPLRPDTVIAGIRAKIGDPNVATNPNLTRALSRLNEMLQSWTNQNGVITPEALYAIRKNGINGVIEELMPNADVVTRKQFAAKVMAEVRPLIDDAIEKAGGKGWRNYLRTFEAGMADIERKEVLARAMEIYQQSPDQFVRLIQGNNPSEIESILGPGKYDIVEELQGQLGPLEEVVQGILTRAKVGERAAEGATAASDILRRNLMGGRVPNFLSPKVALTNAVLAGLEGQINQKTLDILIKASRSGKNANEALNVLPATERNKVLKFLLSDPRFAAMAGTSPAAAAFRLSTSNALAPPSPNNNALSE